MAFVIQGNGKNGPVVIAVGTIPDTLLMLEALETFGLTDLTVQQDDKSTVTMEEFRQANPEESDA